VFMAVHVGAPPPDEYNGMIYRVAAMRAGAAITAATRHTRTWSSMRTVLTRMSAPESMSTTNRESNGNTTSSYEQGIASVCSRLGGVPLHASSVSSSHQFLTSYHDAGSEPT